MKLIQAYESGNPEITDDEYDAFYATNGESLGTAGTVCHRRPLTSLKKVYLNKDKEPTLYGETVETVKLDGCALSLLYIHGELASAATRGDGAFGTDVTVKVRSLIAPAKINTNKEYLQVDGEFVCPASIPNARNVATGMLVHLQDMVEFKQKLEDTGAEFIAYRIGEGFLDSFTSDMLYLHSLGLATVFTSDISAYPSDGRVIRLDSNKAFYDAGITGNCTNGGYAIKVQKKGVPTVLKSVVWQTSPKGRVSPVGLLEPINIDGATVSRVTLHNINFIKEANIKIGSTVGVVRSGDIIPAIISSDGAGECIQLIDKCPACDADLEFDDTHLTCVNDACCAKQAKLISHFFSSLGVKGFGIKTSEKFEFSPAEILTLPLSTFCSIIGNTVGKKLFDQVQLLKSGVSNEDLLFAMSIPRVGKNTSKSLPDINTWPTSVEAMKIGDATKTAILDWYNSTFFTTWKGQWPLPTEVKKQVNNQPNSGIKVVATGKFKGHTRDSLNAYLNSLGVSTASAVSSKINYLVCEQPSTSSSYKKAVELNIKIVTLQELENIVNDY